MKDIILKTPAGKYVNFIPSKVVAVVPSDTVPFQEGILYVGTGGDVVCIPSNQSTTVTFSNIQSGTFLPIYIKAVYEATTASDILVCY